jgi:rubrerythrin
MLGDHEMDIYEFAMKMEADGEKFYRSLMKRTDDQLLKAVLNLLAREEMNHYKSIAAMKNSETNAAETTLIDDTQNVFEKMAADDTEFNVNTDDIGLYKEAIAAEEKSRDFYLEKADEMIMAEHKEMLLRFAEEEERHRNWLVQILESGTKFEGIS